MKTLKIIGDSILKGVVYSPTGRHYSLCKEHRAERMGTKDVQIINLSKMGATVKNGLSTLEADKTPTDENTAVILEFGGNDCNYDWNEISENPKANHTPHVLPEEFRMLLQKAIRTVKEKGAQAIVALAPPIVTDAFFSFICKENDPGLIMEWLKDKCALYRRQEYYMALAGELAREENCPILDLRAPFLPKKDFASYICEDGTHPNAKGHQIICEEVRKLVQRLSR